LLLSLHIRDFAIIERLDVEFGPNLNIVTGETGAGKSIVLGALKLLLGDRASPDLIRTGARKSVIEARFDVSGLPSTREKIRELELDEFPEMIIRREIGATSSRAFVNDSPVVLSTLRDLCEDLVDLHGQHDQQSLLRTGVHRTVIDAFGGLEAMAAEVRRAWTAWRSAGRRLHELEEKIDADQQRADLLDFQRSEIDAVSPDPDEEDALHSEQRRLANASRLREESAALLEALYDDSDSLYDRLSACIDQLGQLARLDDALEEQSSELRSALIVVGEVASSLRAYAGDMESDPRRLEDVHSRIGSFEMLKRKYGGSIEAVLAYRVGIDGGPTREGLDRERADAEREVRSRIDDLSRLATELSLHRAQAARDLEPQVARSLARLGMNKARFEVEVRRARGDDGSLTVIDAGKPVGVIVTENGIDHVEFHISTNEGEPPKPLSRIASGGEVSRVMLALKRVLADRQSVPVMVFDEIDVGISGAIAQAVGEEMRSLARDRQVIAITHLPQIAAQGDLHFVVEKSESGGRTAANLRRLTDEERAAQVARLISGARVTETAVASARELLTSASETS